MYGPYPASQMLAWSDAGMFGDTGVFCRDVSKVMAHRHDFLHDSNTCIQGDSAPWYNSKRVDFDIYQ